MKKTKKSGTRKRRTPSYHFTPGVRGKYAARYDAGTNLARLDPDVAARFPDSESVNRALRGLVAAGNRPAPGSQR